MSRYVVVGLVNTAFGYGVFASLELTAGKALPYLVILLIAHVVGVLEAFVLQRRFVFPNADRWVPQLLRFWSVYLGSLAINIVLLPLCVEVFGLPVLIAQALVLGALALGTFFVHSVFTFAPQVAP
jgi:putative flippase GtrA